MFAGLTGLGCADDAGFSCWRSNDVISWEEAETSLGTSIISSCCFSGSGWAVMVLVFHQVGTSLVGATLLNCVPICTCTLVSSFPPEPLVASPVHPCCLDSVATGLGLFNEGLKKVNLYHQLKAIAIFFFEFRIIQIHSSLSWAIIPPPIKLKNSLNIKITKFSNFKKAVLSKILHQTLSNL